MRPSSARAALNPANLFVGTLTLIYVAWVAGTAFQAYKSAELQMAQVQRETEDRKLRSRCAEMAMDPNVSKDQFANICGHHLVL